MKALSKKMNIKKLWGEPLQLFLIASACLGLIFIICYLPLFGWIYAFFNYKVGMNLFDCEFVGFKYFKYMLSSPQVFAALKNTLIMSFYGLLVTPLAPIFAIILSEIRSKKLSSVVQTATTLPHFISMVIVFALCYSLFSIDDGFLNKALFSLGLIERPVDVLGSEKYARLMIVLLNIWKNIGFSAIIYLAAIKGISPELYEAAYMDGASRFKGILHITIPGLLPTFFTLFLLNIGNILNSGFETYYLFCNMANRSKLYVLDLYVYSLGFESGSMSLSIAISAAKSIIGVFLLFTANYLSKVIRGNSLF